MWLLLRVGDCQPCWVLFLCRRSDILSRFNVFTNYDISVIVIHDYDPDVIGIFQAGDTMMKLYNLFIKSDATLLEINPMAEDVTEKGERFCL